MESENQPASLPHKGKSKGALPSPADTGSGLQASAEQTSCCLQAAGASSTSTEGTNHEGRQSGLSRVKLRMSVRQTTPSTKLRDRRGPRQAGSHPTEHSEDKCPTNQHDDQQPSGRLQGDGQGGSRRKLGGRCKNKRCHGCDTGGGGNSTPDSRAPRGLLPTTGQGRAVVGTASPSSALW